jgi:PST family polysaccharide transporter
VARHDPTADVADHSVRYRPECSESTPLTPTQQSRAVAGDPSTGADRDVRARGTRAVLQLVVRAVGNRIIGLAGAVILARLLSPADFGLFAVVSFGVLLLALIGDGGVGSAIVQQPHAPTNPELGTALTVQLVFWTAMLVVALVGTVVAPVVVPNVPRDAITLARLFAVAVWLNGLRAVPAVILTRDLRFGPIASVEVSQQLVYFGIAVGAAASGFGVVSFGVAAVAQSLAGTTGLWLAVRRWPGLAFDPATADRLLRFGIGYQLALVLHWARDSVIAVFGGLAGGLAAIGLIQFAWRNGSFALTIEEVVARAALPAFSRLQSPAAVKHVAARAIEMAFLAVAVIQAWLVATAPTLVPVVFSAQWVPAVPAFQLVCIGSLAWAPVLILRALVYSRGEARRGLELAGASLVAIYILFPILTVLLGIVGAGVAYVTGTIVALVLYVRATASVVQFPWRSLGRFTVETAVAAVPAYLMTQAVPGLAGLMTSGALYLAAVGLLLFVFERPVVRRMRDLRATARATS